MKPEAEKIGGLNVPDAPPVPADLYCPYEFWVYGETSTQLFNVDLDEKWPGMTHSAFDSARRNHVFASKKLGPRGGYWWAIVSERDWKLWRDKYIYLVETRLINASKRGLMR